MKVCARLKESTWYAEGIGGKFVSQKVAKQGKNVIGT